MAHSGRMTPFDPTYLTDVIADRGELAWFSPARQNGDFVAGPTEVYLSTGDGTVTWGWTIEPVPVDPAGRRFRRFRHPDGWALLTDADDPETVFLAPTAELHTVAREDVVHAVAVEPGAAPGSGDAYALQKAAEAGGSYHLEPAWTVEAVSAALALWCEIFLGAEVGFVGRPPSAAELAAIDALLGTEQENTFDTGRLGHDEEMAALVADLDDVFWFQADLTWPDRDDDEAFRDRVDVRIRFDDGADTWLLSIEPLAGEEGSARRLGDDGEVALDPDDPTVVRLGWDRMVLAVSVQETGFEPAGLAVPLGDAPGTEQWEELRRVRSEHPESVVIHAPAWSEHRISLALTEWASAWTGAAPRFVYDFDDPVSQAAIEANNLLEGAAPAARSIRTATRQTCLHTDEAISPHEVPLPCGQPATAYYRDGEEMQLVCDAHAPPGVKLTTLLRA